VLRLVTFTFHHDVFAGENAWQLKDPSSAGLATFYVSGIPIWTPTTFFTMTTPMLQLWNPTATTPYTSGYRSTWSVLLPPGNYTIDLNDTYGNGWAWLNATGSDAVTVSGPFVAGSPDITSFTTGTAAIATFTVL
jgi:hypothetical protein